MPDLLEPLSQLVTQERLEAVAWALVVLVAGLVLSWIARIVMASVLRARTSPQHAAVVSRVGYYVLAGVSAIMALRQLGMDLSVLLGAAGILTVAVGFASQTSASNLISGLFLMGERPFVVGDILRVGATTGEVVSIDLLAVKLRTFDNLFVRVPNETILKNEIINLTRFPIRRVDVDIPIPLGEEMERVRSVLVEVADRNPLCLDEPPPLFVHKGFTEVAQILQFSVWGARESFLPLRNGITEEARGALGEAGIPIPVPARTIVVQDDGAAVAEQRPGQQ